MSPKNRAHVLSCGTCGQQLRSSSCTACVGPPAADESGAAVFAHVAIYSPPWQESGAVYGPRTEGAYRRDLDEYESVHFGAINSPALYDQSREARMHVRAVRDVERKDGAAFEARADVLAVTLGQRQWQASVSFFRDRASYSTIARTMGVAQATVREWVRRTRQRIG